MASDNMITVSGSATRDVELRFTSGGRAVASFGLAHNRRYQKDGEWVDAPPTFFNIVVWGDMAEHAAECVSKGTRVIVVGRMESRQWETAEGEKRTQWEIIADDIGPSLKWATATVMRTERTTAAKPASREPVYEDTEAPF